MFLLKRAERIELLVPYAGLFSGVRLLSVVLSKIVETSPARWRLTYARQTGAAYHPHTNLAQTGQRVRARCNSEIKVT